MKGGESLNVNLCSKVMHQKPQNVIRVHGTGKCEFMELLQFAATPGQLFSDFEEVRGLQPP